MNVLVAGHRRASGPQPPAPSPRAATPWASARGAGTVTDPHLGDQFVSYATARDADTSAAEATHPNAFLAQRREALKALRAT